MNILFEKKFYKDIAALSNKNLKQKIEQIIIDLENAASLNELGNVKKLQGHKSAIG